MEGRKEGRSALFHPYPAISRILTTSLSELKMERTASTSCYILGNHVPWVSRDFFSFCAVFCCLAADFFRGMMHGFCVRVLSCETETCHT